MSINSINFPDFRIFTSTIHDFAAFVYFVIHGVDIL